MSKTKSIESIRIPMGRDELRAQHDELKTRDPGTILLFVEPNHTVVAIGADIDELRRLARGVIACIAEPVEGPERISFRREDLETLLGLIVQAGRRAAVLERMR